MICPACKCEAHGLDRCEVAARKRALTAPRLVVNATPAVNKTESKKRGAYPATDKRREYMREKMRERRSQEKRNG